MFLKVHGTYVRGDGKGARDEHGGRRRGNTRSGNEIGCERLQGYFFDKPMAAEALQEKIASGEYTVSSKT